MWYWGIIKFDMWVADPLSWSCVWQSLSLPKSVSGNLFEVVFVLCKDRLYIIGQPVYYTPHAAFRYYHICGVNKYKEAYICLTFFSFLWTSGKNPTLFWFYFIFQFVCYEKNSSCFKSKVLMLVKLWNQWTKKRF